LISARATSNALTLLQMMTATIICSLAQATDMRNVQLKLQSKIATIIADSVDSYLIKKLEVLRDSKIRAELTDVLCKRIVGLSQQNTHMDATEKHNKMYQALSTELISFLQNLNIESPPNLLSVLQEWQQSLVTKTSIELSAIKKNYVDGEADYLLGNTKHLYLFVRNKLNVKLNRGDEDPGIDIDVIFKSIQDESIFPVIVKCFGRHIK